MTHSPIFEVVIESADCEPFLNVTMDKSCAPVYATQCNPSKGQIHKDTSLVVWGLVEGLLFERT